MESRQGDAAREMTLKESNDNLRGRVIDLEDKHNQLQNTIDILQRRIESLEYQVNGPQEDTAKKSVGDLNWPRPSTT